MKKILFSLQVFGLIALIPVYVVLEMNHGKSTLPATETSIAVMENTDIPGLDLNNYIVRYPMSEVVFNQGSFKTKKKNSNAGCSCQNCKCGNTCTCNDL